MAITPSHDNVREAGGDGSMKKFTWVLLSADPDGVPVAMPEWADKTFEINGTFGGATCEIQGSNGGAFQQLHKASAGTGTTYTAAGIDAIIENPLFVKPILTTVGAGATITVILLIRRANPLRT
jgi:hypothetical protein